MQNRSYARLSHEIASQPCYGDVFGVVYRINGFPIQRLQSLALKRPCLYCVLSPNQIKFTTRKKFKHELDAAEICSTKSSKKYGIKFALPRYQRIKLFDATTWFYTVNLWRI